MKYFTKHTKKSASKKMLFTLLLVQGVLENRHKMKILDTSDETIIKFIKKAIMVAKGVGI